MMAERGLRCERKEGGDQRCSQRRKKKVAVDMRDVAEQDDLDPSGIHTRNNVEKKAGEYPKHVAHSAVLAIAPLCLQEQRPCQWMLRSVMKWIVHLPGISHRFRGTVSFLLLNSVPVPLIDAGFAVLGGMPTYVQRLQFHICCGGGTCSCRDVLACAVRAQQHQSLQGGACIVSSDDGVAIRSDGILWRATAAALPLPGRSRSSFQSLTCTLPCMCTCPTRKDNDMLPVYDMS